MSSFMKAAATGVKAFPSDGVGGATTFRITSTAGSTTYTTSTVADTGNPFGSVVAGDFVGTTGGYWARALSAVAGTVTVDFWRTPSARPSVGAPDPGLPANGTAAQVTSGIFAFNRGVWVVERIVQTKTAEIAGVKNVDIVNPGGVALISLTLPIGLAAAAGPTSNYVFEFSGGDHESGLRFPYPVGLQSTVGVDAIMIFHVE